MSSLRPPILGPIVGHTTSNSCRLWVQGGDPGDEKSDLSEDRRTVAVIGILDADMNVILESMQYFRLHREFDRSGVFNLGVDRGFNQGRGARQRRHHALYQLQSDTRYRVRIGTLALDDAMDNDRNVGDQELAEKLPDPAVWAEDLRTLASEDSEADFWTFPEAEEEELKFLIGSCRYPGMLWKKKRSDRIFGPMLNQMGTKGPGDPRFSLMVGDQIYADMFHRIVPLGLADTYDEFQERYQTAFGSLNMRRLLRNSPTYMILDDHEIEDNWTQDRIYDRKKRILFQVAIGAYMSYQWAHGPRTYGRKLYYEFDCGGYSFFVLDARTQRYRDENEDLDDNYLLGRPSLNPESEPGQLDYLCRWLSRQQDSRGDRPKFIVSSGVFVPNPVETTKSDKHKNRSDSWPAFPNTRMRLLDHIVANEIQNVVFLSGDIHCSNVAKIRFSGSDSALGLRAFSITSSAFYWPFPFADGDPADFVRNSRTQSDSFPLSNGIKMDYTADNFTQEDNFSQVDIDWGRRRIHIQSFDVGGKKIHRRPVTLRLA